MLLVAIIQEFGPRKTHAAWTVVSLGAAMAVLVAAPLFVMFLYHRTRLREKKESTQPAESQIDPWIESGRRLTEGVDSAENTDSGADRNTGRNTGHDPDNDTNKDDDGPSGNFGDRGLH